MSSPGELGQLTDAEYADLNDRVDRFHAAWTPDGSTALEAFVPPAGARHRLCVLLELIKTDMERRAQASLPVRVEIYLGRFRDDVPFDAVPVSLLVEEYRLRHRYADKPAVDEYRGRFPDTFAALVEQLAKSPPSTTRPGSPVRRIAFELKPPLDTHEGGPTDQTRLTAVPSSLPQAKLAPTVVPAPSGSPAGAPASTVSPAPGTSPRSGSASPIGSVTASDILPADLRYKLLRRLGKGAFGEVYEALAPGGFKVAIKKILRALDHPATQGELEALEAIKALNHAYLIQMHAFWVFEDRLVLVMDLADCSLADRIEHHRKLGLPGVPPEELIPFFEQAGEALDYLHSQNVSHRDVKPQNLLILKGVAQVADFGLARNQSHTLTNIGVEVGTPLFMAPEVWNQQVSLHSDQYSLAATYVAARLGRNLYSTKLIHDLAYQHVHGKPDLSPLPEAEQQVLLKALAKNPDERYPSCLAFAKALRRAVLSPPPPATPPRRWVLAGLLGVGLVCALAIGLIAWFTSRTGESTSKPWCPAGWSPAPGGQVVEVEGRKYHERLTREIAGETLVALLIPRNRPSDPPTFYMLENKITNRVFRAEWDRAMATPSSAVRRFRDGHPQLSGTLLPEKWRLGVKDRGGRSLGIDGERADLPVLGVTVPEAMLVAEELGGLLPTYDQWLKALGMNDGKGAGPAGPALGDPPAGLNDEQRRAFRREQLRPRHVAIGLDEGPWPVQKSTGDVSVFGIREMVSNGLEWTGETNDPPPGRVSLSRLPAVGRMVIQVGQSWELDEIHTFARIRDTSRAIDWADTAQTAGFRIVLEPR